MQNATPTMFKLLLISLLAAVAFTDDCQKGRVEQGVSDQEKDVITGKHNEVRSMIAHGEVEGQPKGTNLKRLVWDDALAAAAQDIANTCVFAHVGVTDGRWSWVGQNLYQWSGWNSAGPENVAAGADWDSAVMSWFNEYKDYHYPDSSSDNTGHYTQVVWADTEVVGCGYAAYVTNEDWKNKFYVCNYGPGGNWAGQAPYEAGDSGCEDLC